MEVVRNSKLKRKLEVQQMSADRDDRGLLSFSEPEIRGFSIQIQRWSAADVEGENSELVIAIGNLVRRIVELNSKSKTTGNITFNHSQNDIREMFMGVCT
jgi:hypothetical protein